MRATLHNPVTHTLDHLLFLLINILMQACLTAHYLTSQGGIH